MSRFDIFDTPLEGVKRITRNPAGDERGWFERVFCLETLQQAGWPAAGVVHVNASETKIPGTVRGMHYQLPPHAEYKYVSCTKGAILDVALDLREGSPTFLQHYAWELSEDNHESLIIPHGVAHGFQALKEDSRILYLVSAAYDAQHEGGIHPQDPRAGINWPLPPLNLSPKDGQRPFLSADYKGIRI